MTTASARVASSLPAPPERTGALRLRQVLAMESRAALDFMALLCRLIAQRLREIDEKVTGWRIMSGSRPDDDTTLSQTA